MNHLEPCEVPLEVTPEKIEAIEEKCLKLPQVTIPLTHRFAPGVYIREVNMPAGTFVIGHEHKTRHFNIVLTGEADVVIDGKVERIKAPCVLVSEPKVRKMIHVHKDMRWLTVHPTEETDVQKLEEMLIIKSTVFQQQQITTP